jgi:hypothetical protein
LIVAEKSISVSNVVNGTTRLQPCVLLIGQAAGALAALAVQRKDLQAALVPVRSVQRALLNSGAYLMPYADVSPSNPHFMAIQRVGATGLLQGKGQPSAWANRTWFYPDSTMRTEQFLEAFPIEMLATRERKKIDAAANASLTIEQSIYWISLLRQQAARTTKSSMPLWDSTKLQQIAQANWQQWRLSDFNLQRAITRSELAVLLDALFDPFSTYAVNHYGVIQL